ncbi:MAG: copper oxidase [Deltaproteobacteria bacterium]|nr:copper oxidase [Deltaproteobacteria bacterium]
MSDLTRRDLFATGAALGVAALAGRAQAQPSPAAPPPLPAIPAPPAAGPDADGWHAGGTVIVPDGARARWREVGGVKVFHLIAEPITHEVVPGLTIQAWGYNGRTPGPVIEVTEGDRCRIYVTNKLPEPTTVHWHGVLVPFGQDGVAGLSQPAIAPGATWRYDFVFPTAGTFMYHPHADEMTQIALGMMGMIIVHPRGRVRRARDFALMLHQMYIPIGATRPDPLAMTEWNQLTFNGRSFPGTSPLVVARGEVVRFHFGNLGPMDHHPIHLHGHTMKVVETDGGPVPVSAQWPETTVLVPTGSVRVVELVASAPGDWPMHCHMTHHMMNQMGHHAANTVGADVGAANAKLGRAIRGAMIMGERGMADMAAMGMPVPADSIPMTGGPGPFGNIDMGGMFTILKVRDRVTGDGDPGWYAQPPGSAARLATDADLAADGIAKP